MNVKEKIIMVFSNLLFSSAPVLLFFFEKV